MVYSMLRPELRDAVARGQAVVAAAMEANCRQVAAGATLVREEESHDRVYYLRKGWMARSRLLVDGGRQLIVVFLPNEIVGAKCMLFHTQPDGIVALDDATLGSMDCRELQDLAARDPDVAVLLMYKLVEDERRLHNWTVAMSRPALERIAVMLLEFRGRLYHQSLLDDDRFHLPMTQEQIGERAGLSAVHVNRNLRILRERAIATVEQRTVRILDLAALRELALPSLDMLERIDPAFGAPTD